MNFTCFVLQTQNRKNTCPFLQLCPLKTHKAVKEGRLHINIYLIAGLCEDGDVPFFLEPFLFYALDFFIFKRVNDRSFCGGVRFERNPSMPWEKIRIPTAFLFIFSNFLYLFISV